MILPIAFSIKRNQKKISQELKSASRLSWTLVYMADMIYITLSAKTPTTKVLSWSSHLVLVNILGVLLSRDRLSHTWKIKNHYRIMCCLFDSHWKGLCYSWPAVRYAIVRFDCFLSRLILIYSVICQKFYLFFVNKPKSGHLSPRLRHSSWVREELLFPEENDSNSVSYFN